MVARHYIIYTHDIIIIYFIYEVDLICVILCIYGDPILYAIIIMDHCIYASHVVDQFS
jgi:hypothetical protein